MFFSSFACCNAICVTRLAALRFVKSWAIRAAIASGVGDPGLRQSGQIILLDPEIRIALSEPDVLHMAPGQDALDLPGLGASEIFVVNQAKLSEAERSRVSEPVADHRLIKAAQRRSDV